MVVLLFAGDYNSLTTNDIAQFISSLGLSFYNNGVPIGSIININLFLSSIGANVVFNSQSAASMGTLLAQAGDITATVNGKTYLASLYNPAASHSSNSVSGGAIAGIVIGCAAAVVIVIVLVVVFRRREGATYEVDEEKNPDEFCAEDEVVVDMRGDSQRRHLAYEHASKRLAMPGETADRAHPVMMSFRAPSQDFNA